MDKLKQIAKQRAEYIYRQPEMCEWNYYLQKRVVYNLDGQINHSVEFYKVSFQTVMVLRG